MGEKGSKKDKEKADKQKKEQLEEETGTAKSQASNQKTCMIAKNVR